MHPFTSLTLWALAAGGALWLPQSALVGCGLVAFLWLALLPAARRRARYVAWLMFSLGVGFWLVHGGWLTAWLGGPPLDPRRWSAAITLWLRILTIIATAQLWLHYVPARQFIRALFASRLPPGAAYLLAGPLLVVEQLKRQLATIHEAQRARGVPLDGHWHQRLSALPALIVPLTHGALNDLAIRGAALDMRAFRLHSRRTTLWAPPDSALQRYLRYLMLMLLLAEVGIRLW